MGENMSTNELKADSEFNFHINLLDGRSLPEGHRVHDIPLGATDVTMLKEIMNLYIPTDSPDNLETFSDHKMDFSINMFDTLYLITKEKLDYANGLMREVDKQESDISHKILKPVLIGQRISPEEKIRIYDEQERLYIKRRKIKDAVVVLSMMVENFEKMRNYILGMNKRRFLPASERYGNSDDYKIPSKIDISKES